MAHLLQRTGVQLLNSSNLLKCSLRYGHRLRGRAPGDAKTLSERLNAKNMVDPELSKPVNIGFPYVKPSRVAQLAGRLAHLKKQRKDPELERLSRERKLEIDLEQVREDWLKTSGPFHIRRAAEHYGVFEHLFGAAYFVPRVELRIRYETSDGLDNSEAMTIQHPVRYGNLLKPTETRFAPIVEFDGRFQFNGGGPDGTNADAEPSWWTLVLTNPDGHLESSEHEYCHWFLGNIPNGDISKGETLMPYLQPFPTKGTGYHRHIFVLYKQHEGRIDYSHYRCTDRPHSLAERTFRTLDFYRAHQDRVTPAGLAFFQCDWDASVTTFFHERLGRPQPVYEYDFPQPYIRDQEWFPQRKPFNLYMDKYRDPAQIRKEYLARKLARVHPFEGPEKSVRFPNAHPISKDVPSWLRTEIRKDRLGWGRINDIQ